MRNDEAEPKRGKKWAEWVVRFVGAKHASPERPGFEDVRERESTKNVISYVGAWGSSSFIIPIKECLDINRSDEYISICVELLENPHCRQEEKP
jgi:hypothetical protein